MKTEIIDLTDDNEHSFVPPVGMTERDKEKTTTKKKQKRNEEDKENNCLSKDIPTSVSARTLRYLQRGRKKREELAKVEMNKGKLARIQKINFQKYWLNLFLGWMLF